MDEQTFQAKFTELLEKIRTLPQDQRHGLEQLAEQARQRREHLQESVGALQDSMDHLRLSVKYLVFDLEATRRENAYLRRLVEQINRDRNGQDQRRDDDNFLEEDHPGAD